MYANLIVRIAGEPEPLHAYRASIHPSTNELCLALDRNNGNSSHPEPDGERYIPLDRIMTIEADF
jgi:hypothetical protein